MALKTKRKAEERQQVELKGELVAFLNTLVARKDLAPKSRHRYKGLLLNYQAFLEGASPCPEASERFPARFEGRGLPACHPEAI